MPRRTTTFGHPNDVVGQPAIILVPKGRWVERENTIQIVRTIPRHFGESAQ
jgi:hypothetical protein